MRGAGASTNSAQTALFDDLRRGLSYHEEVTLLCALRGRWTRVPFSPSSLLPTRLNESKTALSPRETERFCCLIERDVLSTPLFTPIHPRRLERWRSSLPGELRSELDDYPRRLGRPWIRSTAPVLSGRSHRAEGEIGCLFTRSLEFITAVVRAACMLGVSLALGSLPRRSEIVHRAGLTELFELDSVTIHSRWSQNDALVRALRQGLARASSGASGPAHVLQRFQSFLLATALNENETWELRALVHACALRDGDRLTRVHGQIVAGADSAIAAGVRDLLLTALGEAHRAGESY